MPALGTNVLRIELTLDKDDAILAKDECDAIEQNPLGDSLSAVREALREAESKIPNEASESHDSNDPERPRLFTAPIGTLL
ncbi:serine/threonine-protein kinase Sgk2 [Ophiocordyceps sinensis CO18]|nr:serine/threonine-protein kinase Sgk2 [Ophiocordyceps sinensis CO18]